MISLKTIRMMLLTMFSVVMFIGCGGEDNDIQVNAGEDQTINLGESIIMRAESTKSGSFVWVKGESMEDGQSIISFNWTLDFTATEVGIFPFTVQVKDTNGFARDTVTITVVDSNTDNTENQLPITDNSNTDNTENELPTTNDSTSETTIHESTKPLVIKMKALFKRITMKEREYPYTIDWGDGSSNEDVTKTITHKYPDDDIYTIKISGTYPHPNFNCSYIDKLVSIEEWGDMKFTSMKQSFEECNNVVFNASGTPDLSKVTDMSYMFHSSSLDSTFNSDLSQWDVSNVTNMKSMFSGATLFNQDLSSWNTLKVTDMSYMFYIAKAFNQDIGSWNVSNVSNMENMFSGTKVFNQNIGRWDVAKVTNMIGMFQGSLQFNQDITTWDTSNVENMAAMFREAEQFNQDISNWDFSKNRFIDIDNSNMSTDNYSKLLLSLVKQNIKDNGEVRAGSITYSKDAESAKFELINQYEWNVHDGGLVE